MTKAVFRPGEIAVTELKVFLDPPTAFPELSHLAKADERLEEITEVVEEYTGPTVDDIRREAEAFKDQWESEKAAMVAAARAEAERIIKEADESAFREVKRRTDEAQVIKRKAQDESEKMIAEAEKKAKEIETEIRASFEIERKESELEGFAKGREAGFAEGKAEVERLVQRTQTVLERAQDKRAEILEETEQEIVSLVLLIARKVIKVISENQKNVVVSNVVQALRKVKGRGNILIRVNISDLKLATDHIKDFINLVEGAKSLQIVEDSSVDEGGCIIETDFGEIDARIANQLAELEAKILEISPIKSKAKGNSDTSAISDGD
ncbi:MAG: flagellar assembly protein FliH [Treponema sp.]|nr:flagellar assembly protein FliH [Treponema sp.]